MNIVYDVTFCYENIYRNMCFSLIFNSVINVRSRHLVIPNMILKTFKDSALSLVRFSFLLGRAGRTNIPIRPLSWQRISSWKFVNTARHLMVGEWDTHQPNGTIDVLGFLDKIIVENWLVQRRANILKEAESNLESKAVFLGIDSKCVRSNAKIKRTFR